MNEVIEHLVRRVSALVAACLGFQYVLLVYVVPAISPSETQTSGAFAIAGRIAIFGVGTTACYLCLIGMYIRHYRDIGWRKVFPYLDLNGTWKTRYQSNKASHPEGDIGIALVTQDWLGNVAVRGSYESHDDDGITDANWESTSFKLLTDSTGCLRAILTYHSRRTPRTGENILAKDGTSARGVEELNIYPSIDEHPARMEGMFYVYAQKAAKLTSGKASWEKYDVDAPSSPPDVYLNTPAVFALDTRRRTEESAIIDPESLASEENAEDRLQE